MKLTLLLCLGLLCGCASQRPTQGLLPSCALYALADCAEIQYGKPIPGNERLRVWRGLAGQQRDGITLDQAFDAAERAGWVPGDSYLHIAVLDDVAKGPLIAVLPNPRHAVTVLAVAGGTTAICLDPRYSDPQAMPVDRLERETRGFYWRVAR